MERLVNHPKHGIYADVNGPSNTMEFLRFFEEAFNSINPNTGRPCLEFGDVIIMDNCPFHHNEGGEVLKDFLNDLNVELVYMPVIVQTLIRLNMCSIKVYDTKVFKKFNYKQVLQIRTHSQNNTKIFNIQIQ
jgi:hypothetical protein